VLDRRGRLFVEDHLLVPLGAPATPAQQSVNDGTLLPVDQTFLLHSRPTAQRTIYLNFKGATLSGTAWNSGPSITALPFDLDGVPGTFSTAELQRIQAIWQRVAEDFAPFDVNVTTEPPAADKLTRSSGTDQVFGTTVLITSSTGVYACSCGGVAYIGVFDDTGDYYKPALVFYNQLGAGNEKYVAEAISHEAGHNMGLNHDGTASVGYYQGHGSGATGWAPIMGVGYYQPLVQWSKGQYSGANNVQDDYTVMAANGLPVRTDDHGNTAATASALSGSHRRRRDDLHRAGCDRTARRHRHVQLRGIGRRRDRGLQPGGPGRQPGCQHRAAQQRGHRAGQRQPAGCAERVGELHRAERRHLLHRHHRCRQG
jgi:hypothetical protein